MEEAAHTAGGRGRGCVVSQAPQELGAAIFATALFAVATSIFVRAESKAGAWISVAAFLSFSLMAAWWLWRLL